jgi:hypothetical protein
MVAVREPVAMGAVTLRQKLNDLSKFAIKLFSMFEALSWEKSDSAAIDTFGHQVRGDSLLFAAIFLHYLHLAQTNNGIQPKMIATNFMAFTRTATV